MESKTKTRTEIILIVMNVLAWITFIGLMVKAGAYLVSYGVSLINTDASRNIYMGLNLHNLREFSFWHYTASVSLIVAVILLEAYTAYLVIRVLSKIKLANPFTIEVSKILEKMSYFILVTWIVAMIYNGHAEWLMKRVNGLEENLVSGEFLFIAAVVFVIAQIFKRGVEIQSENELTI